MVYGAKMAGVGLGSLAKVLRSPKASPLNISNDAVGNHSLQSTTVAGSIKNVNPGYPDSGRTHNCVNCAVATDATLAGNPTSALPVYHKNGIPL